MSKVSTSMGRKMDEAAKWNIQRWQSLADADALFTRPALDLTPASALELVDAEGLFGEIAGKDVLCLAGGGGQQSAAFALLGANVTVFDLSEAQLERDRQAAAHYHLAVNTIQGDMRDLSALPPVAYAIVYQPFSLGFVPDASVVFEQVSRVIRPDGIYYFAISNPYYCGLTEADWNGEGYVLKSPYLEGAQIVTPDPDWVYARSSRSLPALRETREYRQTLSRLLNSLAASGFLLMRLADSKHLNPDLSAEPGTWDHRNAFAPAWLAFWLRYHPGLLTNIP
jgi:2-polyprenyl-3-methyl-5-hydroxy-6-metoxy-1,4-benzoquinol methylase